MCRWCWWISWRHTFRQFQDGQELSDGTFDNLSFIQALTGSANLLPTAIVLAAGRRPCRGSPRAVSSFPGEMGRVCDENGLVCVIATVSENAALGFKSKLWE